MRIAQQSIGGPVFRSCTMFSRKSTARWEETEALMLSLGRGDLNQQKSGGEKERSRKDGKWLREDVSTHWPLHDKLQRHVANIWQVTPGTHTSLLTGCTENLYLKQCDREKKERMHFLDDPLSFSLCQIWSQRAWTPQDFSSCHQPWLSLLRKPNFRPSGVEQIRSYHIILDNS